MYDKPVCLRCYVELFFFKRERDGHCFLQSACKLNLENMVSEKPNNGTFAEAK